MKKSYLAAERLEKLLLKDAAVSECWNSLLLSSAAPGPLFDPFRLFLLTWLSFAAIWDWVKQAGMICYVTVIIHALFTFSSEGEGVSCFLIIFILT